MKRKITGIALILALSATSMINTGCFGSFSLLKGIWGWNKSVSGNKWVQWLVFVLLTIIPVYALGAFADTLIFNTLEFWTGSNPLANADSNERLRTVQLDDTHQLILFRVDEDNMDMTILENGVVQSQFTLVMVKDGMELRDANGVLIARVDELKDAIEVMNGANEPLATYAPGEAAQILRAYEQGGAQEATQVALRRYSVGVPSGVAAR